MGKIRFRFSRRLKSRLAQIRRTPKVKKNLINLKRYAKYIVNTVVFLLPLYLAWKSVKLSETANLLAQNDSAQLRLIDSISSLLRLSNTQIQFSQRQVNGIMTLVQNDSINSISIVEADELKYRSSIQTVIVNIQQIVYESHSSDPQYVKSDLFRDTIRNRLVQISEVLCGLSYNKFVVDQTLFSKFLFESSVIFQSLSARMIDIPVLNVCNDIVKERSKVLELIQVMSNRIEPWMSVPPYKCPHEGNCLDISDIRNRLRRCD